MESNSGSARELFAKKAKELWEQLSDDLKWAKDMTELRLQMEFLEVKQDRLFKEYGKQVFLTGQTDSSSTSTLLREIQVIEAELEKKHRILEALKAQS